jgi:hypothetical protein
VAAPGGQAAPWLRLAGFGRVGAYALTAHFALISTGAGRRSERWALTFIYLCAAALACALMLPPGAGAFGAAADALLQAFKLLTVGWSVARLMRRGREGDRPEACREARVLALFTAAVLPGAAFDALNGARFHLPLPPLEPLLFLLPAAGVLLRARKIPLREPSLPGRGEAIPDDSLRRTASRVAAAGLISGGTLLVALECLWRAGETSALIVLSGAVLAALGAALLAAERRGSGYGRLEMFLIAASLAVTPLITVGRVPLGGMTIWAFPLMLVVCALAFNFNGLLAAAAASLLFGQAYLWGVAPAVGVLVDGRTYAGRSIVALTVLAAAEFARRMYRRQIRDSAVQAEIHGLISAIAGSFSQADRQNAPEKVRQLVDQLSEFYQTPNALVCAVEEDFAALTGIRVAGADGTDPSGMRGAVHQALGGLPAGAPARGLRRGGRAPERPRRPDADQNRRLADRAVFHGPEARGLPVRRGRPRGGPLARRPAGAVPIIRPGRCPARWREVCATKARNQYWPLIQR